MLMPNLFNFEFVYYHALLLGTAVYIPGFPKVRARRCTRVAFTRNGLQWGHP